MVRLTCNVWMFLVALGVALITAPPARGDMFGELLFDSLDAGGKFSGASGLAAKIEFEEEFTLGGIGLYGRIDRGDLPPLPVKYVAFDSDGTFLTLLGSETLFPTESFSANPSWRYSNPFEYTFEAGTYFLGAIADPGLDEQGKPLNGFEIFYDGVANTSADGRIHSLKDMARIANFAAPQIDRNFASDAAIRLYAPVPEPSTLLLWGAMALVGLAIARYRRRAG